MTGGADALWLFLVWCEVMHNFFSAQHELIAPTNLAHHNCSAMQVEPAFNSSECVVGLNVGECSALCVECECGLGVHYFPTFDVHGNTLKNSVGSPDSQ